jgi:hypothetical protein
MKIKRITSTLAHLKSFTRWILSILSNQFMKSVNLLHILLLREHYQVLKFGLFDSTDKSDLKWEWWSRAYEYPWILDQINALGLDSESTIHNTSWGHSKIHKEFKNELESLTKNVTNSDFKFSTEPNTSVYDVTKRPPKEWNSFFDFVLNISTVEEIPSSQIRIIKNLFKMVKPSGYLLITFDLPGLQLKYFEKVFGKIDIPTKPLNGINSDFPMEDYAQLRCGFLILQKLVTN